MDNIFEPFDATCPPDPPNQCWGRGNEEGLSGQKHSNPKTTTAAEINIDLGDRGCYQHLLDSCMGSIILSMYCPRLFVLNTYWGGGRLEDPPRYRPPSDSVRRALVPLDAATWTPVEGHPGARRPVLHPQNMAPENCAPPGPRAIFV